MATGTSSSSAEAAPSSSSSERNSNFARLCWLLIDTGTQVLRDVFDNIHKPTSLHTVLHSTSIHRTLRKLKCGRILNTQQWSKLYPSKSTSVSSASFDITLLFALLRNICNLTPPLTGWDKPAASDLSKEADLARLKWYRNEVYAHRTETAVSDADFEKLWTEISAVLIRLGGQDYKTSIQRLKVEPMDSDDEKYFIKMLAEWNQLGDELLQKMDEVLKLLKGGKPVAASASEAKGATNVTYKITIKDHAKAVVTNNPQFHNVESPFDQPALEKDDLSSRAQGSEKISQAATSASALCDTDRTVEAAEREAASPPPEGPSAGFSGRRLIDLRHLSSPEKRRTTQESHNVKSKRKKTNQ